MTLYSPPETRWCEVFSVVPEPLRLHGARSEWIDANKPGQSVPSFLEGPVFDASGHLYLTDIPHGRIFRVTPAGEWAVISQYDGGPNGMQSSLSPPPAAPPPPGSWVWGGSAGHTFAQIRR